MQNDFEGDAPLSAELAALHRRLQVDGAVWQATLPTTDRLLHHAQRLTAPSPSRIRGGTMSADSHITPSVQPIPRAQRVIPAMAAVLLVVAGALIFATFAHRAPRSAPATASTPTLAQKPGNVHIALPPFGYIGSIALAAPNDGWASVGISPGPDNPSADVGRIRASFYHLHDGVWSLSPDAFPRIAIGSLVMPSLTDGWAVGGVPVFTPNAVSTPVVLRYQGGHWREVTIPVLPKNGDISLDQVSAPAPGFMWIDGSQTFHDAANNTWHVHQFALTYQNGIWDLITTPFGGFPDTLTMVGPNEGWGVHTVEDRSTGTEQSLMHIYHYQGGTWKDVTQFPGTRPLLSMVSAQEG